METEDRQFYVAVGLLLAFIAGVIGGAAWGLPRENPVFLFGWMLAFGGILFAGAATRK